VAGVIPSAGTAAGLVVRVFVVMVFPFVNLICKGGLPLLVMKKKPQKKTGNYSGGFSAAE
jgi:hypothetical protein